MPQQLSDAELLHAMKEDDTVAFRALYDKYWEPIYLKACQRVDKDTAKDLVQEVMTTLWRRRKDIHASADGGIDRYLFTAIKYRVISHYAYSAEEIRNSDLFDVLSDNSSWNTIETKELNEFIESEISRLPPRMQQVFRMSREDDHSIADIAHELKLSEQTVKNQLTEALKRLRGSIQSHDGSSQVFIVFLLACYFPHSPF